MVCLHPSTVQCTSNTSVKSVRNTNTLSEHARDEVRKTTVQLELDLARDVKGNEKGFYEEVVTSRHGQWLC